MKPLLILRPQPGAAATLKRAEALGLKAIVTPLFEITPINWTPPDPADFDAVLLTSAHAARSGLSAYRHLPAFAVGAATAQAAREGGFTDIIAGDGSGEAILAVVAARGGSRLFHPVGREHIPIDHPGITIERHVVYGADAVETLPVAASEAVGNGAVALLHSRRAAEAFGGLVDAGGLSRACTAIVAISEAVRHAAGTGWAVTLAAPLPKDEAMLAIAGRLCDQGMIAGGGEDAHERL